MLSDFGVKVRQLRESKGIAREEFCGDETELSVRQLARIETGSLSTLSKAQFIAKRLGVSLGELTDGESLELPDRYKELKYLILRTPTYMDSEKLKIREEQFDEIYEDYYDKLPEEEKLMVTFIQSKFEVYQTGNVDFGTEVIKDYFNQLKKRKLYKLNDLVLIELFLLCSVVSNFDKTIFDEIFYEKIKTSLINQSQTLPIEDLYLLNSILLVCADVSVRLQRYDDLDRILLISHQIMTKIQDFQKMPIYYMLKWEYCWFGLNDFKQAEECYKQAILFAGVINGDYLVNKLEEEWRKLVSKIN